MRAVENRLDGIAVIGMAGRFPGANDLDAFWENLRNGVESISFFTDTELEAAGVVAPKDQPSYIKAGAILEGADQFDAKFFGITPKEAEITDPQHRLFLECAWEALESAGCDPERVDGPIGVFAGMSLPTYLHNNLLSHPELLETLGAHAITLNNDKDYLAMRVSYKLNLRGPSLTIQTACSTSLVAVCTACQHLLTYQCDLALAGGVSLGFPQKRGYWYQEGGIASPDGHCRAFDAQAAGTVTGEGVGIVVLKRLAEALADRDPICAVIKGFAVNNDGAMKAGFSAPSVQGQAEAITTAQAMAGFPVDTIGYVETHGTATPLGDPIEIAALTQAFRTGTPANGFCAIGSVKTNIGHLDAAAGVAGLIKTVLALQHKLLPPSLHFEKPNPQIDFANSPFHVNHRLVKWKSGQTPRRAGVSSFGIGGTNAHVVLEEAPAREPSGPSQRAQLLLLSAKTSSALDAATANLAAHLRRHPELNLADVAYTLRVGRRAFSHRRMLVCRNPADAVDTLEARDAKRVVTGVANEENPPITFLFPGQGAQRANVGRELYEGEPAFREQVDRCAEILQPHLELDLRTLLYPDADQLVEADTKLAETFLTQPALFAIEYALARLWMSWGVRPRAMIGHSSGEYVAACLAGVFSLDDALKLVATRGRLMQALPRGSMLAVRLPEPEVRSLLDAPLDLSAINNANLCVVAGPTAAVEALQARLAERGVACRMLNTSHAFHSAMMDPILKPFADTVRGITLKPPQIPYLSNVTGRWITAAEAVRPEYWSAHIRQTARFAEGVAELLKEPNAILLETGPGQNLSNLVKQHPHRQPRQLVLASLPQPDPQAGDLGPVLHALGQLWLAGGHVDGSEFFARQRRQRVRLPAYPFERQRYWIEPAKTGRHARGLGDDTEPASAPAKPAPALAAAEPKPATPKDALVAQLKSLFTDVSGLKEIDTDATFVELGLDSLFLTQVSHGIERIFGVRTAFRELLGELATLDKLANHLEAALPATRAYTPAVSPSAESGGVTTALERGPAPRERQTDDVVATLPLTEGQREIWFATQMGDDASCAFNESCLLYLRGTVHLPAIRKALQALVDRHEALRTTISPTGDSQEIHRHLALDLLMVDLAALAEPERERQRDGLITGTVQQPFDLVNGPLCRAQLVRLAEASHLLILTLHHLVCDGGALGTLLRELAALYSAECSRQPSPLPPALSFADYVRRQTAAEQSPDRAGDDAYWLSQFSGALPVLELPIDRPRPAGRTFSGAREACLLDPALSRLLRQWSAQRGSTLFATLLATCYVLLHKLTGQEDIVVGIPTAGRAFPGGENLVGHCINFLPLRARINGEAGFLEHLETLKQSFFSALDHRHCAFGRLIRQLDLPRDPSRIPLVSATFTMDRLREGLGFCGAEAEVVPNPRVFSNFDLSFNVIETDHTLKLDCRYRTDLFDAPTIQRWLAHFVTLLRAAVTNPSQPVGRLPLLTEAERGQLLVQWNDTRTAYPQDTCLHQLIEQQTRRTPDATALVCGQVTLTYRQLNHRANSLARRLRVLGVGPDALVGLCLERSLDLVVGLLGILKAGGAYVPLDPAYPRQRLAFMLEDSRAAVVVTQEKLAAALPVGAAKVLCLDVEEAAAAPEGEGAVADEDLQPAPDSGVGAEHLAYVIYTSGSTGQPKGVMVTHRNVVNFLHAMREQPGITDQDTLLGVTTLSFDIAGLEIFLPLTVGAKVVLALREAAADGRQLAALIEHSGATVMQATPSTWRLLLDSGWGGSPRLRLLCGGEAVPRDLANQLAARGAALWNLYGPTETTIWSTRHPVRPDAGPVPIGRPIANTELYILNHHLDPVPIGVPGELYLGGDGLARGYWNQPELTREKFVPHPFSGQAGARLYRTGDVARYRPDGNVEFLGRADHQVKIRGHRIELGEIESTLARHPAVRRAVAVAWEDTPGDCRLAAYVVPATDSPPSVGELLAHLRQALPDYMVPATFAFLERLPLTPNGKVDRRALPAPDAARPGLVETFVAPSTTTEVALAEVWRDVLRLDRVGVRDNFFDLGGHSVLATQVLARVWKAFRVELPLRTLFETPTIAGLASIIDGSKPAAGDERNRLVSRMPAEHARELLANVDQLSETEVESLLGDLLAEERVSR